LVLKSKENTLLSVDDSKMKLEITNKNERSLLSRTEVSGNLSFESKTPSNDEVRKSIASSMGVDESLIVMRSIYTRYGELTADFSAYVYKDKSSMEKVEPKKKKSKDAEAKPEAKPKEKSPKEESKEEKKEEPKASGKKEEKPAKEKKE